MDKYKNELRERWGDTSAYAEYSEKTKGYSKEKLNKSSSGLMEIFAEIASYKNNGFSVNSPEVQSLVVKLQGFITKNYYTCTDEILADLGKMYVADERFKQNIDKFGDGTAEFAAEGIRIYVEKK